MHAWATHPELLPRLWSLQSIQICQFLGHSEKGLAEPEPLCLAFFHLPSPAYSTTLSLWSASSEHRDLGSWFTVITLRYNQGRQRSQSRSHYPRLCNAVARAPTWASMIFCLESTAACISA